MDCIFCKIIDGEIPSYTVYEDEIVKVFLDVNPTSNGHMLVVPKHHTLNIDTIDSSTLLHVMNVAKMMKQLLEETLHVDGVSLIQNNGLAKEVKHFHLHVQPYYEQKQELLLVEQVYKTIKELK